MLEQNRTERTVPTMPKRRTLPLSDDERRALTQERDHHPHRQVRERCAALLKVADGMSPHRVAREGLLRPRDPDTLYAQLDRHADQGLPGLCAHLQGGYYRARL